MKCRLRRTADGHSIVVAARTVAIQRERASKRLIQERRAVLGRGAQFDEIDRAVDRAGTRERMQAHEIFLKNVPVCANIVPSPIMPLLVSWINACVGEMR